MNPVLYVDWSAVAAGLAASPSGPLGRPLIDVLFEDEEGSQGPQGSQYGAQGAQGPQGYQGYLLADATPEMLQRAIDSVNDFTRTRMREDGFYRRIMPPLPISDEELDRAVDTDRPVLVVDRTEEPAAAAFTIPFGTLPVNAYIRGPVFAVNFDRILTPRFVRDRNELETLLAQETDGEPDDADRDRR